MTLPAEKDRLNVLFLSQRFLYPMDTGGKIRTGKILEKLKDRFNITLIGNVELSKDSEYLNHMSDICCHFMPVPWIETKKYTYKFYISIFIKLFSRYPITILNDYSKDLEENILKCVKEKKYNILICDFLQSSLNFRKLNGFPTILFQHNVESVIVRRLLDRSKNYISKIFWWMQTVKMEMYEKKACEVFDGIITVSDLDKNILEEKFSAKDVFTIPTGIDAEYFRPRDDRVEENSLVFTGSMDWLPNEDAILFFAQHILDKIREQIPQIKLTVVGRNPSERLLNVLQDYPEIEVVGWVKDVRPFISRHALYVIPLRIGGGTRIKVYEAMAMGKAVVSTHVGVEGLPVVSGEHVCLADEPQAFAHMVVKLLRDSETRRRLEMAAREFVCMNFSWDKTAEAFADICWQIVNAHHEGAKRPWEHTEPR